MYQTLKRINTRPQPYSAYTAETLWNDPHTSKKMLEYHLNPDINAASRSQAFIDRSVTWIARHFGLHRASRICDFGCGPGLYTSQFAALSGHVTGLDFSVSSLAYAKAHTPEVNYVQGNYLDFESSMPFDLITMIMCDFCALSPEQRARLLQKFRTLLADGGSVLLDVYSLNAYDKRTEQAIYERNQLNGFWSEQNYFAFVNTFKYDEVNVVLDRYHIYVKDGQQKEVYNWFQHYSYETLTTEVEANGLAISECFANVAGDPFHGTCDEFAVVLKRA
ncbi:class I SAM-dependent methyltransferase [Sulfurimonas sp. HSL1-2]|uniref:class I SAM-dependent methyltransferase n=1 Tax=Thiomicrolovo zhangzhouensis TaxID=3131933 RepID=UPI0031F8AE36